MRWLEIEPTIAKALRTQKVIFSGTILGLTVNLNDPLPIARRYMKLPPEFDILDFNQSKNQFLFHLSRSCPQPYKTAFEFVFRVELGGNEFGKMSRSVMMTPFIGFLLQNNIPIPLWIAEIMVSDRGSSMLLPFVSRASETSLFELARVFQQGLPANFELYAESQKAEIDATRAGMINAFEQQLKKRVDAWGTINPVLFWTMVPQAEH